MERTTITTTCDVCKRKKKDSFRNLQDFNKWTKYSFCRDWSEGCHSGTIGSQIIVCDRCDKNGRGVKHFFNKYIKVFLRNNPGVL